MMKTISMLIACLSVCISVLRAAEETDIKSCPVIGWRFKSAPYLNAAIALQKEGKEKAVKWLRAWAGSGEYEDQVVILCRMLFEAKEKGEFRRPRIGGPSFLGGTDFTDWPLEPIALHEGVPILVTQGYSLAGQPESSQAYLQYCIDHCNWRAAPYASRTPDELKKMVARWLSTQKWPRPLDAREKGFFAGQAEPDGGA